MHAVRTARHKNAPCPSLMHAWPNTALRSRPYLSQACGVGPHVRATGLHGGPASSPCPPSAVPGNQRRSEALLPWCARAVAAASRLWTPSPWCRKLLDLGARGRRGAHVHAVKDFIWPPWSTASRQVRVAFRGVWHQYRHVRRSGKVVSYSCIDASAIRTAAWLAGHL